MIAIVDYGAGNLFSVKNAMDFLQADSLVTRDPADLAQAQAIILPGVGAFTEAMDRLEQSGLTACLKEQASKKPFLGICLGMQMLFEKSFEFQQTQGLGLLVGNVCRIEAGGLKIPHMGWNALEIHRPNALTQGLCSGDYVYFVHSYMAQTPQENITATASYGEEITAFVAKGNIYGTQFHPEKSGAVGLQILRNFAKLAGGKAE